MIHNRFYIYTIFRVIGIALTCLVIAFSVIKQADWYIAVNFILLLIIQVYLMFTYLNRVNRDLTYFFGAITSDDSSLAYKKVASSKSFERLYELFDLVNQKIQFLKLENAQRSFYLQHLVENAGIGILSYSSRGNIDILNPSARALLNIGSGKRIAQIDDLDPVLVNQLKQFKNGEQHLVKIKTNNEQQPLSVRISEFVIQGETIRLLTIQNIKNELEENELISWQKLIRTLTHEIMNSIGPISSTIKTIKSFYAKDTLETNLKSQELMNETITDTVRGLDIIDDRAQGMLDFVDKFRSLTFLPELHPSPVCINELMQGIANLFASEIHIHHIQLTVHADPESIVVHVDKQLFEQVLINLVTNSIHALDGCENKKIRITAFIDYSGKNWIQVTDNGAGIPEEFHDKIFIPFFTTREKGSGIGLSLSRQIMRLHKGKISFTSVPGRETVFSLVF